MNNIIYVLFTILLCSSLMNAKQDETIPKRIYDVPTLEDRQIQLEKMMVGKFLWAMDLWIQHDGPENEMPERNAQEKWYALVVSGDKNKGYSIWVKFYLVRAEFEIGDGDNYVDIETWDNLARRKRAGVFASLERQFLQLMDDEDAQEAILNGDGHLYHLPTQDFDITKLTKRELIY